MSAAILSFPQTPKALRRRRASMGAAGFLSLLLMDRDGVPAPVNVMRIDEPDGITTPERSPEILFGLLVWHVLSPKQKERFATSLRAMVFCEHPDPCAVKLHNLLTKRA